MEYHACVVVVDTNLLDATGEWEGDRGIILRYNDIGITVCIHSQD